VHRFAVACPGNHDANASTRCGSRPLPVGVGVGILIGCPRRERRDHAHRVEALPLAERHGCWNVTPALPGRPVGRRMVSGRRHVAARSQVSPTGSTAYRRRTAARGPSLGAGSASIRVLPLLLLGPVRAEAPLFPFSPVRGLVRPARPAPLSRAVATRRTRNHHARPRSRRALREAGPSARPSTPHPRTDSATGAPPASSISGVPRRALTAVQQAPGSRAPRTDLRRLTAASPLPSIAFTR